MALFAAAKVAVAVVIFSVINHYFIHPQLYHMLAGPKKDKTHKVSNPVVVCSVKSKQLSSSKNTASNVFFCANISTQSLWDKWRNSRSYTWSRISSFISDAADLRCEIEIEIEIEIETETETEIEIEIVATTIELVFSNGRLHSNERLTNSELVCVSFQVEI